MEVKTFFFRDHHDFGEEVAKSETKSRKLSAYTTATVCFKCTAGPSIISIDRIWVVIKKGYRPLI